MQSPIRSLKSAGFRTKEWVARQRIRGIPTAVYQTYQRVRGERLTYLSDQRLFILVRQLDRIMKSGVEGSVIEAGCALGGSSLILCQQKEPAREMFVYDVFETIPAPSEEDGRDAWGRYEAIVSGDSAGIGGDEYYGYIEDLYERVKQTFNAFGLQPAENSLELIRGDVEETLRPAGPVALAHVDVDWYRPVKICLERITPHLSRGGAIILDDYDAYSGCRKATDEFLSKVPKGRYRCESRWGPMIITRVD